MRNSPLPTSRPTEELQARLAEQIQFLENSVVAFDNGNEAEYQRIAVAIRILVHDTGHSHSLLGQLGIKNEKGFFAISNTLENAHPHFGYNGLIVVCSTERATEAVPYLDGPSGASSVIYQKRLVSFSQWWNEPVCRTTKLKLLTRGQLVLHVANEDGGAHVDPNLDSTFAALIRTNALGLKCVNGGEIRNQVAVSIRHIAHELLKTLVPNYKTHYAPLDDFYRPSQQAGLSIVCAVCAPPIPLNLKGVSIEAALFDQ